MSGFDEEAERERLRKKYERDQEERAATQRMSELLLKGATMTNSHCDTCGDPLFRHDGQTFCPTCRATERDADASPEAETEGEAETGASPADAESTGTQPSVEAGDASASTPDSTATGADSPVDARVRDRTDAQRTHGSPRAATGTDVDASSAIDDARASLSRTLVRYARAAEDAADPRRAEESLAAAREAAEALAALDRR